MDVAALFDEEFDGSCKESVQRVQEEERDCPREKGGK